MIPDFQTIMLPFLKHIRDGKEYSIKELNLYIADLFKLNEEERNRVVPSGTQRVLYNRITWACYDLRMAGLVEAVKRGHFKITELGKKVASSDIEKIDIKYLSNFDGFLENSGRIKDKTQNIKIENLSEQLQESTSTPEEILESNYITIKKNLASELLIRIKQSSPAFFENLVVELLVKMGYGGSIKDAGKSIGRSGDEGIDGIIKEDKLGLDVIYIQAKRWEGVIGRPEIQKFVGALAGQGAKKGVFITTSKFTKEAKEYHPRNETKIVLIDGEELAELMIEHNLAVSTVNSYLIKKIDNDYFDDLD